MITRNEGALGRLFGTADQFVGKELSERRCEFRLRIGLACRSHEEAGIVLHARDAFAKQIRLVMKQHVPFPIIGQSGYCGVFDEFFQIGIVTWGRDPGEDGHNRETGGKTEGEKGSERSAGFQPMRPEPHRTELTCSKRLWPASDESPLHHSMP